MSRIEKTVPTYDSVDCREIEEAIDDLDPERMMDDFETNFEHLDPCLLVNCPARLLNLWAKSND